MKYIQKFESYTYYNKELCPVFWDNFKFNERIREKLLAIAMDFFNNLNLKNVDVESANTIQKINKIEDILKDKYFKLNLAD